jgi:hypothetical protein
MGAAPVPAALGPAAARAADATRSSRATARPLRRCTNRCRRRARRWRGGRPRCLRAHRRGGARPLGTGRPLPAGALRGQGARGPEERAQAGRPAVRIGAAARKGIELTTVGFGMGNYNDELMEQLADRGQRALRLRRRPRRGAADLRREPDRHAADGGRRRRARRSRSTRATFRAGASSATRTATFRTSSSATTRSTPARSEPGTR